MSIYKTHILDKNKIAQNTMEVVFAKPGGFAFTAGQYIQIRLPNLLFSDQKGSSRVFSITSSPYDKKRIAIAFRTTGSGFKKTIENLALNSEVLIEGPHGHFVLPEDSQKSVVMIAGGIGVAPFVSMLRGAFGGKQKRSGRITLIYGNKNKKRAAYLGDLKYLSDRAKNFKLIPIYRRIDEEIIRSNLEGDYKEFLWFVAGPPLMVDNITASIQSLGVSYEKIFSEGFLGY